VSTRLGVLIMSAVLVIYLVAVAQLSISLMISGDAIAQVIGVALIVLPVIGAWAMGAELLFGLRSQRLADRLAADDQSPVEELPVRASGRPDRAAAEASFPAFRDEVEQHPDDWRAWFRLGMAYDASGDRRRGRQAIRRAIALERAGD